ncbi:hypothetical protein [Leptolyngbya sp. FACHB-261]|uniref:hypothetical protein n=1 Tax=Leptolyngbya sp. FACHB-261 TaxID=2692806 RepID=UPI001687F401|nr:hypothetical protein [Leptolyngbya sp. FACHB-261]MBD2105183.1 hypothetical protein [Leptolyngbya sp. FACHB-261]
MSALQVRYQAAMVFLLSTLLTPALIAGVGAVRGYNFASIGFLTALGLVGGAGNGLVCWWFLQRQENTLKLLKPLPESKFRREAVEDRSR